MDSKRINELLSKYWNCETSLEEEAELREHFKTGNIPDELKETAPLFQYFEENKNILNRLVRFASKGNIKVIFYTSPAYQTYVSNLNSDQLRLTIKTINEFVNENSNCSYYNFLNDTSFSANDFRDADHLNDHGAKKLSLKLEDIINNSR